MKTLEEWQREVGFKVPDGTRWMISNQIYQTLVIEEDVSGLVVEMRNPERQTYERTIFDKETFLGFLREVLDAHA